MSDLAFVTWSDSSIDREDAGYYLPSVLQVEHRISKCGALRLGDLVRPACRTTKPDGTGTITYIDIASVDARTGGITPTEIPASEAPSRARKLVATDDLLISSVRPERNAVARVPATLDGAIASTGFHVIHPLAEWSDHASRLFLFMKTEAFIRQARRRCTSSMYPVISEPDLLEILIPRLVLEDASPAEEALQRSDSARRHADAELARARTLMNALAEEAIGDDPDPKPPE